MDGAVDYYLESAGTEIASRFANSISAAIDMIRRYPAAGSPHLAAAAAAPGLRANPVPSFPYLIISIEVGGRVRLLRMLHQRRDIPAALALNVDS